MDRLWVRLSLAISGVFLALIILPATILLTGGFIFATGHRGPDLERSEYFEHMRRFDRMGHDRDKRDQNHHDRNDRFADFDRDRSNFSGDGRSLFFIIPPLVLQTILCVGVVGILIGAIVSRGLTKPISTLAKAAQTIGGGNLAHRVNVKGSREMTALAQSFNQMAADLETAETQRRSLMADVSHELRTPLTVLEGNLRAALDHVYELDDEALANLYGQTRHLIHLVDDLRILALAEAQKLPLALQETDMNQLITETITIFAPLAEEKGVTLTSRLPDTSLTLNADTDRLRQVLHNLISNALRHTPDGGNVTIAAIQESPYLTVRITDTGEGIPPELVSHIFDRFYRVDRSRSRDTGGTGLGLAIVKAIVEAHGGQVAANSKGINEGSTFTLRLSSA